MSCHTISQSRVYLFQRPSHSWSRLSVPQRLGGSLLYTQFGRMSSEKWGSLVGNKYFLSYLLPTIRLIPSWRRKNIFLSPLMESSWSVEAEILLSRVCMLLLELPRWKSVRVLDILQYLNFNILNVIFHDLKCYGDHKKEAKMMKRTKDQPLIRLI